MVARRFVWVLATVVAFTATFGPAWQGSGAAWAQDGELELLRRRFREGMALEEQGKWAEALAVFEEVAAKKQSAQVRFHVALCKEQLGQLLAARTGFMEALALAQQDPQGAKEVLDAVPKRVAAVDEKIPHLVLAVAEGGEAEVVIDDEPAVLVKAKLDITLDPGSHRVAVLDKGTAKPLRTVTLAEGERMEIKVPKRIVTAEVIERPDPTPEPAPPERTEPGTKIPFFVVGGVGLASLVVTGVMIGLRQASISEVRDACEDGDAGCDPSVQEVAERGERYERAAWGLGIAGAACLGAATVLYFTVGRDTVVAPSKRSGVTLRVSPMGFAIAGAFD